MILRVYYRDFMYSLKPKSTITIKLTLGSGANAQVYW